MNIYYKIVLLGCFSTSLFCSAPSDAVRYFLKHAAISVATYYVSDFVSAVTHEMSHALINTVLTGSTTNVSLFKKIYPSIDVFQDTTQQPWFNIAGVKLYGFTRAGTTSYCTYDRTSQAQRIFGTLAGPVGGLLSLMLIKKVTQRYKLTNSLATSILHSFMMEQLIANLVPLKDKDVATNDGYKIAQELGVGCTVLKKISDYCHSKLGRGFIESLIYSPIFCTIAKFVHNELKD